MASSASDRNSNQFQSPLILWFKCNKKKQLPILIILIMFMSKTENLIIIMLISILLIPVYPSTYSSHPVFLLSLNLQQHIFFIFFLTGAKDMGNYIFFPVPSPLLPPSLAIPLFALHATVPSVLTIFSILLLFFIGIASGNLYRGESIKNPQSFTIWCYKRKNTKNTTKNNHLLFYA